MFLYSIETVGIFSFDHERLLNNKNIFGELQKQKYWEVSSIIGFHMYRCIYANEPTRYAMGYPIFFKLTPSHPIAHFVVE